MRYLRMIGNSLLGGRDTTNSTASSACTDSPYQDELLGLLLEKESTSSSAWSIHE